ncbi:MAG: Sec-independent protein translocase protein TatB [Geminicoccaceae bacterium]
MFDVGWSEMAVILLVALIVIGPKDLPRVARTMGRWAAKGRSMAREFQNALEDMAREAELDTVKKEIEKAGRGNLAKTIENTIDPSGELNRAFDPTAKIDRSRPAASEATPKTNEAKPETNEAKAETNGAKAETSGAKPEASEAKPEANEAKTGTSRAKPKTSEAKTGTSRAKPRASRAKTKAQGAAPAAPVPAEPDGKPAEREAVSAEPT